ncbi:hypothetical protein Cgig2_025046 [Carnegiea gigantea]|uniref:Endonuclease/exonuclease/phosphatase domain-containing protein n=1 Tax=Carnegiea gigantea TaxID=171969 RepID=A0A9Q1Q420_9CARY|nr:hypothetical protein Cgig2_025046 [Carnegiea gigantea]
MIGPKVGRVIGIDQTTANANRGQLSRLSLEVDLSKPLLSKFRLRGGVWRIQYEGIKFICFKCGKVGPREEHCPTFPPPEASYPSIHETATRNDPTQAIPMSRPECMEEFGPWMQEEDYRTNSSNVKDKTGPIHDPPTSTQAMTRPVNSDGEKGNNKDQGMVTNLGKQSLASGSRYTILENIGEDNIAENSHYKDLEIIPSPETDTLLEGVPAQNQEQITEHDNSTSRSNSIMVWNCQGAGSKTFFNTLAELLRRYDPSILALVETKISGTLTDDVCRRLKFDGLYRMEAQGFRGGIWVLWKIDIIDLKLIKSDIQFVTMEVTQTGIQPWLFTAIYASPNEKLRQGLWMELHTFGLSCSNPWLLAGDFNDAKNMEERFNCSEDLTRRSTTPLTQHATKTIPSHCQDQMVADYWDPHEGWKWSLINEYLPEEWLKRIASFEVTQNAENDDQLVWDDHSNGGFTLRSTFTLSSGQCPLYVPCVD